MIIATNTFGLTKEFEADLTGTIRKLHGIGFTGIEPLVLFQEKQGSMTKNLWAQDTLKTAWETMQELGMSIPSVHLGVGFGWMTMPARMVIQGILKVHDAYGIDKFIISAPFGSAPLALRWAAFARSIDKAIRPHGCTLIYHNHDDEFHALKKNTGRTNMDLFLDHAGPDVMMQIDIGWAGLAGDEREIVKRYADRVVLLHLKDFYARYRTGYTRKNMPPEAFSPIGAGAIHTKEVLQMIPELPHYADAVVIDQDKYQGDMLESPEVGLKNIREILK